MQQSAVPWPRPIEDTLIDVNRFGSIVDDRIYDEPSEVDAEEGAVLVKGPDRVDIRFTPAAAEETSERLHVGAMKARGQRYFGGEQR